MVVLNQQIFNRVLAGTAFHEYLKHKGQTPHPALPGLSHHVKRAVLLLVVPAP